MGIHVFDDVAFGWFWMAILGTFLIPTTIYMLVGLCTSARSQKTTTDERTSLKNTPMAEQATLMKTKRQRWANWSVANIAFVVAWIIFGLVTYHVFLHTADELATFDPYEILGVPIGSNVSEIKKQFRKMSMIYHPDRNLDDIDAQNKFILISKAHQTLTDDAARENWEKYGNPDGYSGTSVTIGLPSFLTDVRHEMLVLVIYFLFFLVALPISVGIWWANSSKYDPSGTEMETLSIFYTTMNDAMAPKFLIEVLAASAEFKQLGHNRNLNILKSLGEELEEEMARPRIAGGRLAYINKCNILLHAYLLRMDIENDELIAELTTMLSQTHRLLKSMLDICLMKKLNRNIVPVMGLSQCFTQAVWVYGSPLSQLPHIDEKMAKNLARDKVRTIRRFLEMPVDARQTLLSKHSRILSQEQINDIEASVPLFPLVDMDITYGCEGVPKDTPIHVADVVTFKVQLTRLNDYPDGLPIVEDARLEASIDQSAVEPAEEEYFDDEEIDVDNLTMVPDKKSAFDSADGMNDNRIEAYAPFFPIPKQENWILLVLNGESKQLISLERVQAIRGQISVDVVIQMKDTGPTNFDFMLMSDSYIGLDLTHQITINVLKPRAKFAADGSEIDEHGLPLESPPIDDEEEEIGYWYYLGGASFWEALLHLFLLYVIALLGADILESRGYISWNPFKAKSKGNTSPSDESGATPEYYAQEEDTKDL